MKGDIKLQN